MFVRTFSSVLIFRYMAHACLTMLPCGTNVRACSPVQTRFKGANFRGSKYPRIFVFRGFPCLCLRQRGRGTCERERELVGRPRQLCETLIVEPRSCLGSGPAKTENHIRQRRDGPDAHGGIARRPRQTPREGRREAVGELKGKRQRYSPLHISTTALFSTSWYSLSSYFLTSHVNQQKFNDDLNRLANLRSRVWEFSSLFFHHVSPKRRQMSPSFRCSSQISIFDNIYILNHKFRLNIYSRFCHFYFQARLSNISESVRQKFVGRLKNDLSEPFGQWLGSQHARSDSSRIGADFQLQTLQDPRIFVLAPNPWVNCTNSELLSVSLLFLNLSFPKGSFWLLLENIFVTPAEFSAKKKLRSCFFFM